MPSLLMAMWDVSAVRSPADTHGDGYGSISLGFETCHSRKSESPWGCAAAAA